MEYDWTPSSLQGTPDPALFNSAQAGMPSVTRVEPDADGYSWEPSTLQATSVVASPADGWDSGLDSLLGNTGISIAVGASSGVEAIGALLDAAGYDVGEEMRQSGQGWTQKLTSAMSPEWQEAINKSWLTLDPNQAGWADHRSWIAGIAQQVPMLIATFGAGTGAAVAAKAAGAGVKGTRAAMAGGLGTAGGALTAGDAASSAAQAVDEAGLGEDERRKAERVAAGLSLPFGVAGGLAVGKLLGKGTSAAGRVAAGTVGQGVEEAGTEGAAQTAKTTVGLEFDPLAVIEQGVQGAAFGGGIGVAASAILPGPSKTDDAPPPPAPTPEGAPAPLALPPPGPPGAAPVGGAMPTGDGTFAAPMSAEAAALPESIVQLQQAIADRQLQLQAAQQAIEQERNPANRAKLVAKFREGRAVLQALQTELALVYDPDFPTGQTSPLPPFPEGQTLPLPPRALPAPAGVQPATGEVITAEAGVRPEALPVKARETFLDPQAAVALEKEMVKQERKMTSVAEKLANEQRPGERSKLVAAFREANRTMGQLQERYAKLTRTQMNLSQGVRGPQMALFPELASQTRPGTIPLVEPVVDMDAVLEQLDAVMDENGQPIKGPLELLIDKSVQRSQRAKAAAITRWARNKVPETPADATPQSAVAIQGGNAEAQALRFSAASDKPLSLAGPGEGQGGATPSPQATVAPQAGAAPSEAGNPPGAEVSPPPSDPTAVAPAEEATSVVASTPVAPREVGRAITAPRMVLSKLLADGPKGVDTVLSALSKQGKWGKNSPVVELISRLRRAFPATKDNPSPVKVVNAVLGGDYQGKYDPKTDTVAIDLQNAEDPLQALLHELVHAATVGRMRVNEPYRRSVERLMVDAKRAWDRAQKMPPSQEVPGFRNAEEFIAEALTNTAFQDQLAALSKGGLNSEGATFWKKVKTSVLQTLRYNIGYDSAAMIEQLMEFVPDGQFIEDAKTRKAVMEELDRLGLHEVAPLFSTLRSLLRTSTTASVPVGEPNPAGRVWDKTLFVMQTSQIAKSYGAIGKWYRAANGQMVQLAHDVVNRYYRLMSSKAGFVKQRLRLFEQVVEFYKNTNADPSNDTSKLDDLLVNARMWRLHPDLPDTHPLNVTGIRSPGGVDLHRRLQADWAALTPAQRYVAHLLWSSSNAIQADWVNQMTIARVRGMVGAAEADSLSRYVEDPARRTGVDPAVQATASAAGITPIDFYWQKPLSAAEIGAQVATMGLTPAKAAEVTSELNKTFQAFHKDAGPFVPLRRQGKWLAIVRSPKLTADLTQAQLDRMVLDDRIENPALPKAITGHGELIINDIGKPDPATGKMKVEYEYMTVSGHQTEAQAKLAHAETENRWRTAGRTWETSKPALKQDQAFSAMGLSSSNVEALRKELEQQLGPGSGPMVSEMIMKFYLERLPDTSIRKSQMKARRVAGAERDMLSVYSGFAHGTAYLQGAMRYQPQIGRLLTTEAKADIDHLQSGPVRQFDQAIDLQKLVNEFSNRERAQMETAAGHTDEMGFWASAWYRMPAISAAYFLTGLGTIIANATQVPLVSLPTLGAKHGAGRAALALGSAYTDVLPKAVVETGKEAYRFTRNTVRAAARGVRGKGWDAASFRDPSVPFFEHLTAGLNYRERQLIEKLAEIGKIDYGMVADLQSLVKRQGRAWSTFAYMSAGAFIMPQAMETVNRTVTALASYRLNDATLPANTPDRENVLARLAADDVDMTQFNYESANKAPIMNVEALRAVAIFKTYAQGMYYTLLRNTIQAMYPDTATNPRARSEAIKVVAGITAGTFVATGAMGLLQFDPLFYAAVAVAMAFTGDADPEEALREAMADLPTSFSRFLLKGAPYASGAFDLSRVGLPSLTPVSDVLATIQNPQAKSSDWYALLGETLAGPPGGILVGIGRGAAEMAEGDIVAGLRLAAPKVGQFNDFARAWEYHNQGVVNSRGEVVVTPDEIGLAGVITRAIGFEPPEVAEAKARNRAFIVRGRRITAEKSEILGDFAEAAMKNDRKGMKSALSAIVRFNRANPYKAITRDAVASSIQRRQKDAVALRTYGVRATTASDVMMLRELNPLYGIDPTGASEVGL